MSRNFWMIAISLLIFTRSFHPKNDKLPSEKDNDLNLFPTPKTGKTSSLLIQCQLYSFGILTRALNSTVCRPLALLYGKQGDKMLKNTETSPPVYDMQSRVLPGMEKIHVSVLTDGNEPTNTPSDSLVTTLFENLQRTAKLYPDGEFLGERAPTGRRRYGWLRFQEVLNRAQRIGSALLKLGIRPGESTRIGICGNTCSEWVISSFAAMAYSMVTVPVYHNYHKEALNYIINSCQLSVLFCDTQENVESFVRTAEDTPSLRFLIQMREPFASRPESESAGIQILTFDYLLTLGDSNMVPVHPPKPESIYLICHTSGTTGNPKGVVLTHKAMVANMAAILCFWDKLGLKYGPEDTCISYLPLAHIYEQFMQAWLIYRGVRIGFYTGNVQNLTSDMQELKPTLAAMVPRLLNRLHEKILSNVAQSGYLKRTLYEKALAYKMNLLDTKGTVTQNTLWDKFVFRKIQMVLGGKLRAMYCGGAPVAPEILRYFRAVFGCLVLEGYGQTEVDAVATLVIPGDIKGGHVGGPLPGVEVKLIDVPDMEYFANEDRGEILIRGPQTMIGYYENPGMTSETLDSDGWIHTGDIGTWLPNGGLKIIDRRKHFFKLAQGEFVSPEAVETAYQFSPLVSQIFVDGRSLKSCLIGIVVPNLDILTTWAANNGVTESGDEMLKNRKVRQHVLTEIRILGAEKGLSSLEQVKAVHLTNDPFTNENGMLTPIMKLRRPELRKFYADVIDELYNEIEQK